MLQLESANLTILEEIHKLDHYADDAFATVDEVFDDIIKLVEKTRNEVMANVKKVKDEKRRVLEDQLQIIKKKELDIETEIENCDEANVNVISENINDLNEQLESIKKISEPQENFYLCFCPNTTSDINGNISKLLSDVGSVQTCTAVASNCFISLDESPTQFLSTKATLTPSDVSGNKVDISNCQQQILEVQLKDIDDNYVKHEIHKDGNKTISIIFTPTLKGEHILHVTMFGRNIRNSVLKCEVTPHNSPLISFGTRGVEDTGFVQPCSIAIGIDVLIKL